MTALAATRRTLEIELTNESDPLFRYKQRVTLAQGQTGVVIGWEHVDEETRDKYEEPDYDAPALGWHYSVRRDEPGLIGAIELFSEAQLLRATQR